MITLEQLKQLETEKKAVYGSIGDEKWIMRPPFEYEYNTTLQEWGILFLCGTNNDLWFGISGLKQYIDKNDL